MLRKINLYLFLVLVVDPVEKWIALAKLLQINDKTGGDGVKVSVEKPSIPTLDT